MAYSAEVTVTDSEVPSGEIGYEKPDGITESVSVEATGAAVMTNRTTGRKYIVWGTDGTYDEAAGGYVKDIRVTFTVSMEGFAPTVYSVSIRRTYIQTQARLTGLTVYQLDHTTEVAITPTFDPVKRTYSLRYTATDDALSELYIVATQEAGPQRHISYGYDETLLEIQGVPVNYVGDGGDGTAVFTPYVSIHPEELTMPVYITVAQHGLEDGLYTLNITRSQT